MSASERKKREDTEQPVKTEGRKNRCDCSYLDWNGLIETKHVGVEKVRDHSKRDDQQSGHDWKGM